jgi:hypothetical protein
MGQYYKPVFLKSSKPKAAEDIKGWFYSHSHKTKWTRDDGKVIVSGEGLKLMEHSYIGNSLVSHVERHLAKEPQRVVWAGDYADTIPGATFSWEGDGGEKNVEDANVYALCEDEKEIKPKGIVRSIGKKYRYIVNLDKKEYVDKSKCPEIPSWPEAKIHPLPLLTCEGNGRGGGDYRAKHPMVGSWAKDTIAIQTRKPKGDFYEIVPNFQE